MHNKTLLKTLYSALPAYRHPRFSKAMDVAKIAKVLGVTPAAIYSWLKLNRLPPEWIPKLNHISEGRLNEGNMLHYTFKSTASRSAGTKRPRKIAETV